MLETFKASPKRPFSGSGFRGSLKGTPLDPLKDLLRLCFRALGFRV